MNKNKKELYIENQKLKEEKKAYQEFWEVDIIKEQRKQINFAKNTMLSLAAILFVISVFLMGLMIE